MSLALDLKLERTVLQNPRSNRPFPAADPNSVWLVLAGKIDLFLATAKNSEPDGLRYPVLRLEQDQPFFGLNIPDSDIALFASAVPGTKLACFSLAELIDSALVSDNHPPLLEVLEEWISCFTASLSEVAGPSGPVVTIGAGESRTTGDVSQVIVPGDDITWVSHRQGSSRFLSNDRVPAIDSAKFFPLSKHAWLHTAAGSEIYALDSRTLLQNGMVREALDYFHATAAAVLICKREERLGSDVKRWKIRISSETFQIRAALRRLTLPLNIADPILDRDSPCHDPIFLACESVGQHLGIKITPHPDMLRGISMADPIESIANCSGIRIRKVSLRRDWWKQDCGALLGFVEADGVPVSLLPRSNGTYDCYYPSSHRRSFVTAEIASTLSRVAYVLYRPLPNKKIGGLDLLKFGLKGCKRELGTIVFSSLAFSALGLILPVATGIVFDRLIPAAEKTQLFQVSLFLVLMAFAGALFELARGMATVRLEVKTNASLQAAIWDRLLSLPASFFRQYSSGELAQRALGIAHIQESLTNSTTSAILSGMFSALSFLLLFYYSYRLAIIATVLVAIGFAVSTICGLLILREKRISTGIHNQLSSKLLQFMGGVTKLRISATENRAFASWARDFSRQKSAETRARSIANKLNVFNSVFPTISLAIIFLYYGELMTGSSELRISTGEFLAFNMSFGWFLMVAVGLSSAVISILGAIPHYEAARPILTAIPEVTDAKAHPGELKGSVEISRVSFRYGANLPFVLNDVSLAIRPGQFVAFVGVSGSGKSTLFRLLLGFETPGVGAIYYDGQDLSTLDIRAVRRQLGVVLQSSRAQNQSILRNIIGSKPLTIEDAWEAARMAGLDDDIKNMPMGMHTHISDGGGNISGGQRQRLMIARAIVGRPRILLFDEATSALDNENQALVSSSLSSLQATRIVIAHRLSTIQKADQIFVLNEGRIVESGNYEELMRGAGLFHQLARRQLI